MTFLLKSPHARLKSDAVLVIWIYTFRPENTERLLMACHVMPFGKTPSLSILTTDCEINFRNWRWGAEQGKSKWGQDQREEEPLRSQGGSRAVDSPGLPFPGFPFNKHPGFLHQVLGSPERGPNSNYKESRGREHLALGEGRQASDIWVLGMEKVGRGNVEDAEGTATMVLSVPDRLWLWVAKASPGHRCVWELPSVSPSPHLCLFQQTLSTPNRVVARSI